MTSRRAALLAAALVCTVACAPTRAAAPPRPELVGGQRSVSADSTAEPVTDGTAPIDVTAPTPPSATDDRPASVIGAAGGRTTTTVAATIPAPVVLTGWAAFDQVLRLDLLAGGDQAASVAVMVDGELVHAEAFGVRLPGTFDSAETVDRFRLASISKVITAIVTLRLVEAGRLALDEPVGARLAALLGVVPSDVDVAAITPEHLLSHTSGFAQYESLFFRNGAATCEDAARHGLTHGVSTPGTVYVYSNLNYCLLGLLIADVTGLTYEQAAYEWLLTPLGITGMRLAGTYDVGPDEVGYAAVPGRTYMESLGAAGAWIATAADVAAIVDSLRPDRDGWRPLSPETVERMRRPPFDRPFDGSGYGLGLILYPDGSFGHTGTLELTHDMVVSRADGVTWALLVNGEHPSDSPRLRALVDRAFAAGFPDG